MKKGKVVFLMFVTSCIALVSDASNKKQQHADPAISSKKGVDPKSKEEINRCMLEGGHVLIVYSDGSSKTIYASGKTVDHPPMLK